MKRRQVIILFALVLVFGGVTWVLLQPQDPLFRGKPESEWIKGIAYGMGLTEAQIREQVQQWRELGPEGLRMLQRTLERPPPGRTYHNFYRQLSRVFPGPVMGLLPSPKPQISGGPRLRVIDLLSRMGKDGWPAWRSVARMLADEDSFVRQSAIGFFTGPENDDAFLYQRPREEKKKVLPLFIKSLEDTNSNWGLRNNAALALKYYPEEAPIVAPALAKALQDSAPYVRLRAAAALQHVDAGAAKQAGAAGILIQLMQNSDDQIASAAISALRTYRNEGELAVPALIEALQSTNTLVACSAVWALEWDFPKQANRSIPELKKAAERKDNVGGYARGALKHLEASAPK